MLSSYSQGEFFCEMLGSDTALQQHTLALRNLLEQFSGKELAERAERAQLDMFRQGITFTLYSGDVAEDRVLPYDIIPRILSQKDWQNIEKGAIQRVTALNRFLQDVYNEQAILKDGIVPRDLVLKNPMYRKEMQGVKVPGGVYVHICGIDLIRDEKGTFRVLEDNARTPSGVSYVLQNRTMMLRSFPDLMGNIPIRSVGEYGQNLRTALSEVAPDGIAAPRVVLLSPGMYNSAYFEHVFLAQEMGVNLVEGGDLVVIDDIVYMKTTSGLLKVDVIYRRLDDEFIDPLCFNPKSLLGVPGLMGAYRKGKVTLANAVGNGVADDKAVYAYMPRIIEYYLGEKPILPNVHTYICGEPDSLAYTLDNLEELVVKPVGASGGYGLLIGPKATKEELAEFRKKLQEYPSNYISQPVINLSVCPTLIGSKLEPRHVDLRPFVVTGNKSWVLPGGLTRVALTKGSLVVNSSQGGGSKDTWVLA